MPITPPVDAGLAAWLKSDALYQLATDNVIAGRWGDEALETTLMSCIAFGPDAVDEAVRQLRLLGGPLVKDEHVVAGLRHDLLGKRIRLRTHAPQALGYGDQGVLALVVRVEEADASDTTTLTVIRRLA